MQCDQGFWAATAPGPPGHWPTATRNPSNRQSGQTWAPRRPPTGQRETGFSVGNIVAAPGGSSDRQSCNPDVAAFLRSDDPSLPRSTSVCINARINTCRDDRSASKINSFSNRIPRLRQIPAKLNNFNIGVQLSSGQIAPLWKRIISSPHQQLSQA